MNNDEYAEYAAKMMLVARIVKDMDTTSFLQRISEADTLGPILNPTLWIQGQGQMDQARRMAEGLATFQAAIHETGVFHA